MSAYWCFPVNFSDGGEVGYIMLLCYYVIIIMLSYSLSFIWLR